MSEIDKVTEEIISSLNSYIEKQKKIIEEETKEILEKRRKEFEEYIVERKDHPRQNIEDSTITFSEIQKKMKVLSITALRNVYRIRDYISHLLQRLRKKQSG